MAYSDNYPNGYKDGYSSADDPDRVDYSPYGWERSMRQASWESAERQRNMSSYQEGLRRQEERRERERREREREELIREQQWNYQRELRNQKTDTLVDLIFSQRRKEYETKSFFAKLALKLKGKDIYKLEGQIREEIRQGLNKIHSWEFDDYYDKTMEQNLNSRGKNR